MRICKLIVVMLCSAAIAWPTLGWGPEGHRIVGDVATKYLSAKAKAAIKDLLGDQSLADVANWADEVRSDPAYDYLKPLHYINVPRSATKVDLARDCKNEQCVIGAINHYSQVLKNKNSTREEKITALKLIVHFVGDVHTPLHVSYEDDRGGNFVKVNFFGNADRNLHGVWDGCLMEDRGGQDAESLKKATMTNLTDARLKQWRKATNAIEWANESLVITRQIYNDVPAKGQLMTVDQAYCKKHQDVVEQRLAAAGVRLAALLNSIFGEDKPATRPTSRPTTGPATQPGESTSQPAESETSLKP